MTPTTTTTTTTTSLPTFGSEFGSSHWSFESNWINLNHGSYGAAPTIVMEAIQRIQQQSARAPDRFIKLEYEIALIKLRSRLAEFLHCDTDDLVLVTNASAGVNTVMRSLTTVWEKGDKIMYYSTTIYDACLATLQFIVDSHPHLHLQLVAIPLVYPISHAALIDLTRQTIAAENAKGNGKLRLCLLDAISSNPGVIVPWEELVLLFRERDILSLVDAAHQIGQLPVNLKQSRPDFWLSNCHKWLVSSRSTAVLYVSKPHQYLMHAISTGHYYKQRRSDGKGDLDGVKAWTEEFSWSGTIDYSPILAIDAALDFRLYCGGEERIRKYCHELAIQGGAVVAEILGTEVMRNTEGEGELIANMVNVLLPLTPTSDKALLSRQRWSITKKQILQSQTHVPPFIHNGRLWVRLSAMIYNDLDQFRTVGKVLKDLCERMNGGEELIG